MSSKPSTLLLFLSIFLLSSNSVNAVNFRQDTLARVMSLAQGKLNKNNLANQVINFPRIGQNTVLLSANEACLKQGQRAWSPNKSIYLAMQEDGNLVL